MSEHKMREDRLAFLEERCAALEQILDTNSAVFSDSLQLAELCIQALQRAMDGMILGDIHRVKVEGVYKVDFKRYLKEAMEFSARIQATRPESSQGNPAMPDDAPVVFEFGG